MPSLKSIPGKDIINDPADLKDTISLKFEIQDDESVPGAGMPVTIALCRKIVHDYIKRQNSILSALQDLPSTTELEKIIEEMLPGNQIISGVYGRETIMHLLEQKGCEGIMYINGRYNEKDTVVLIGVDEGGNPIGGLSQFLTNDRPSVDPVLYEVKLKEKSRTQILTIMPNDV